MKQLYGLEYISEAYPKDLGEVVSRLIEAVEELQQVVGELQGGGNKAVKEKEE